MVARTEPITAASARGNGYALPKARHLMIMMTTMMKDNTSSHAEYDSVPPNYNPNPRAYPNPNCNVT